MALSKIGSADAAAASVALPAFTAGDLAIVFAFRDGSTTVPTLPGGWTNLASGSGTTCSFRAGYRVLVGTDTTTSTWTNATEIEVIVLRGHDTVDPFVFTNQSGSASAAPNWPAVSLSEADGSSWIALFGGHRTATDMNSVALTGTTNESPTTGALAMHTVRGTSAAWSATSKTVNANSGWTTFGIEVRAAPTLHDFVSTVPVDVLVLPVPYARESTEPVDVLVYPIAYARESAEPVDVLLYPITYARESNEPVDVLIYPITYARESGLYVDVLVLPSTTAARESAEPVDVVIVPTDQKARVSLVAVDIISIKHYDRITIRWIEEK